MDEVRRRQYLEAMGVSLWRLRDVAGGGSASSVIESVEPSAPVAVEGAERAKTEAAAGQPKSQTDTSTLAKQQATPVVTPALDKQPVSRVDTPASAKLSSSLAGISAFAKESTSAVDSPRDRPRKSTSATVPVAPTQDEPPLWTEEDLAALPFEEEPDLLLESVIGFGGEAQSALAEDPIASMDWATLEAKVADCQACRLCETRHKTVFGVGDRSARLMLIGEGPGQEEDRRGEPFVGRAGQLLDRMLAAVGMTRAQVYIANVVKCRPPKNRNPQSDEADACLPYLRRQIVLVEPDLILCLGGVSATHLLDTKESVGRLRGRLHHYGPQQIPLLVTYHPSYYLRNPIDKAKGWQDLQEMMRLLQPAI